MRILLAFVVVSLTGGLLVWRIGTEPDVVEAASNVTIAAITAQPAPVKAGQTLTIEATVATRTDETATVEMVALAPGGDLAWRASWENQRFERRQTRPLTATWAVPVGQPADVYTLTVAVRRNTGADLARPQTLKVQIAPPDAAAAPGPSAPAPPTQPEAPAAPASYPFAITGSAAFVANIGAGLELMRATSPADYEVVRAHVTEIREGPQNWSWGGSRTIQISTSSAAHSRTYAGSIVLHEAVHVKNWFTNDLPVFGCDGEAKSLKAQSAYLRAVGDRGMADWVEGLIGHWC